MIGLASADAELGLPLLTLDLTVRFGAMRHSRELASGVEAYFTKNESPGKTTIACSVEGEEAAEELAMGRYFD